MQTVLQMKEEDYIKQTLANARMRPGRRWAQTGKPDCPRSARMASYMQAACSLAVKQNGAKPSCLSKRDDLAATGIN